MEYLDFFLSFDAKRAFYNRKGIYVILKLNNRFISLKFCQQFPTEIGKKWWQRAFMLRDSF